MLDHVGHLGEFVDLTRRLCTCLSEWIYSLISRGQSNQVSLPYRSYFFDLVDGTEGQYSTLMASTDPIDISSSDSDIEIEDGRNSNTSNVPQSGNKRTLPIWPNAHGNDSRNTGYGWKSKKVPSPERAHTSNGSSSHFKVLSKSKQQMLPGSSGDSGVSKSLGIVNSRISNGSSANFEKLSSHQALSRTLPPSFQALERGTKSNNFVESASSSQALSRTLPPSFQALERGAKSNNLAESASSSYQLAERNITENYMKDYHLKGNNADNLMYERAGNRNLPNSLILGKSSTQYGGPNDPVYHPGLAEERAAANDERLIYQAALEDLNQPKVEANLPDGLLSVSLLRHQKIALAWMLQKETRSLHCLGGILADDQGLGKTISIIALIQMQRALQTKKENESSSNGKTEALNLDDDEDDADKSKQNGESDDVELVPEVSTSKRAFNRQRPAAGTLVVCPASVVRQWARELDDKVSDEAKLSVLVYHGGNRTRDPVELSKYDVVVTTYSIVTNEVPKQPLVDEDEADEVYGLSPNFSFSKKRKNAATVGKRGKKSKKGNGGSSSLDCGSGPLAKVGWFRVVLDEAQTIKNHRTQVARACCSLRAKRRWCLSGTPIQNAIDDLYSYFRFLRYDPYAVYKSFYNTIKIPISRNSLHGYKKLQAVLRAVMLRRTKGTLIDGEPIINLPPKTIRLTKVDFSAVERTFYFKLHADSLNKFKAYAQAGTVSQNYANILLMLLRLRQACDHPLLVEGFNSDSVGKLSEEMAKRLPRDMLIDLLNRLETSSNICLVCSDPPEDPLVTMCGHVFCYQCVSDYITGDENTCPAPECKEQLGSDVVFSKVTLRSCLSDDGNASPRESEFNEKLNICKNDYVSSKIKALMEILQSICESNGALAEQNGESSEDVTIVKYTTVYSKSPTEGPIKAIVFSQWTRMLDLVEYSLNQYCIQYRRLDGTMSLASRDRAVKDFNNDPEITVMLMSLKAGNLGLNMVAACHVILLDLWWNPTTEDQAIDRAHRIGQTRPVTVTRITIKDTVEDRILNLQEEKRRMVASAFGEDHGGGSATRLTVEDLKYLFMF